MKGKTCRWGILGAATIARKNWKAMVIAENASITAVASRDLQKAHAFINECQSNAPCMKLPEAVGSYEALLRRDDVDAVYIPLPTGLRKDWVIRAAQAGKHVLCEKPCAVSLADLHQMVEACAKHRVQFMDGVMFMHSLRLAAMHRHLNDANSIGQLRRITSQFSFCADDDWVANNIRTSHALEPAGCLGDLGWYNIRFTLWAMGWKMPVAVSARTLTSTPINSKHRAVPLEFSGEFQFDGGVSAQFYCSFLTHMQQWGVISGNKGYLRVDDFVLPYFGSESSFTTHNSEFVVGVCDFNMHKNQHEHRLAEYSNSYPNAQEVNMIRNFSSTVLSGKLNSEWPQFAIKTQHLLDSCLRSAADNGAWIEVIPLA